MSELTLFDFCEDCNINFKSSTSVQIVGCGFHENINNPKVNYSFISTAYLTVQPLFSSTEYDISCTQEELLIIAKMKLPVVARICLHNTHILDERPTNRGCLIDEDADFAKRGIALSNMLSEHDSKSESETDRLPEKEETEDCVKLTWSIPQEFERIKAQAKRLKAEKKKWKRDFKAFKDWVGNFQRIIDNAQKSLSIIGDQNEKGTKYEN